MKLADINRNGILNVLKVECITCNYFEEKGKGTLCEDCPFCSNSAPVKGKPSRVGLKASVFKPLGLTKQQIANWGKCQLFMYLYYPELDWNPPPIPDYDSYGKPVNKETALQTIHHLNGNHNDDTKDNIKWRLVGVHTKDEQQNIKYKKFKLQVIEDCAKILGLTKRSPKKKPARIR